MKNTATATVEIGWHQALSAIEHLVEDREAERFGESDVERLQGAIDIIISRMEQKYSLTP